MEVASRMIKVGRILHEDDELMTIEVAKNEQRQLRIEDGDRFTTLMFCRNAAPQGEQPVLEFWVPWEA